mgnify:CR=1 FL=1
MAVLIFELYGTVYFCKLRANLGEMQQKSMRSVKTRIYFLCCIVQVYLVVYLLLIWLQNLWWYQSGPTLWIVCQSVAISATICIPVLCFSILVTQ